jgi:hypothetical protein
LLTICLRRIFELLHGEGDRLLGVALGVFLREAAGADDVQSIDLVEPQAGLLVVADFDDELG